MIKLALNVELDLAYKMAYVSIILVTAKSSRIMESAEHVKINIVLLVFSVF